MASYVIDGVEIKECCPGMIPGFYIGAYMDGTRITLPKMITYQEMADNTRMVVNSCDLPVPASGLGDCPNLENPSSFYSESGQGCRAICRRPASGMIIIKGAGQCPYEANPLEMRRNFTTAEVVVAPESRAHDTERLPGLLSTLIPTATTFLQPYFDRRGSFWVVACTVKQTAAMKVNRIFAFTDSDIFRGILGYFETQNKHPANAVAYYYDADRHYHRIGFAVNIQVWEVPNEVLTQRVFAKDCLVCADTWITGTDFVYKFADFNETYRSSMDFGLPSNPCGFTMKEFDAKARELFARLIRNKTREQGRNVSCSQLFGPTSRHCGRDMGRQTYDVDKFYIKRLKASYRAGGDVCYTIEMGYHDGPSLLRPHPPQVRLTVPSPRS